mgnify:CR=1 FL=1
MVGLHYIHIYIAGIRTNWLKEDASAAVDASDPFNIGIVLDTEEDDIEERHMYTLNFCNEFFKDLVDLVIFFVTAGFIPY